jgi:hypothetical protein
LLARLSTFRVESESAARGNAESLLVDMVGGRRRPKEREDARESDAERGLKRKATCG